MPVLYDTSVDIPSFAGLNQSGDGYNMSLRYAREMENVLVTGGVFQQMREGVPLAQTLPSPIETLCVLNRRYYAGEGEKDILAAVAGGALYTKTMDGSDEWQLRYDGFVNNDFDYVTYEVNPAGSTAPVDVLLLSNADDGMFCLYGNDLHVEAVVTPYKFGVLARFNERIWGAGIPDMPDSLVYSAPYDPFDWRQNSEIPEDGAGEIMQPSWDGDSFVSLKQSGSYLLCFKKNGVWRIYGTNPGEFVIRQLYGGGTVAENTVVPYSGYVLMLGWGGLMRYDGNQVSPFQQDVVRNIFQKQMNWEKVNLCKAAMRGRVYCLALPLGETNYCNAVLEYDTHEGTFALRKEIYVGSFASNDNRVFYTSNYTPGQVFEMDDSKGKPLFVHWVGAWQDLGIKSSVKSTFTVYFLAEAETSFEMYLGLRTEKKLKKKFITVKPNHKTMRVHMNVQGRFFRLEIGSTTAVPFRIDGGIKIDMELDPD